MSNNQHDPMESSTPTTDVSREASELPRSVQRRIAVQSEKRCAHGNPVGFGVCVECREYMESLRTTPWVAPGEEYEVETLDEPATACCHQIAHLGGMSVEDVQRVGSCGCEQAKRALVVCREHAVEQGRRIESLQDERDVLRRVAIAAAADPFPTPETRTAIYQWWAATSARQDTNADSDRSEGRSA